MTDWRAHGQNALKLAQKHRRALVAAGGALVLAALFLGTGGGGSHTAPPTTVLTRPLAVADRLTIETVFSGVVQAQRRTLLGFELAGALDQVAVDVGDAVTSGQVLATLRADHLKAQEARILAELEQARALKTEADARLELAIKTAARKEELYSNSVGSRQARDEADAELSAARARLSSATSDIARAQAGLDEVRVALDRAVLHAPFAGSISDRFLDDGQVIDAGTPVLALVEQTALEARIGVGEDAAPLLAPGSDYSLTVNGRAYTARLAGLADELDPQTRTRLARFVFPGPDLPTVGDVARLSIDREKTLPGAWVPLAALSRSGRGLWRLYMVENAGQSEEDTQEIVRAREVQIAHVSGDRAYVTGGLVDGQPVIVSGAHRVVPGQAVTRSAATTDTSAATDTNAGTNAGTGR